MILGLPRTTPILTTRGFLPIGAVEGTRIHVWNGYTFEKIRLEERKVSSMVRVWMSDGDYLDCLGDQPFTLVTGGVIPACQLTTASQIGTDNHNITSGGGRSSALWKAYAAGWATFTGVEDNGRLTVLVPKETPPKRLKALLAPSVDACEDEAMITIRYEPKALGSGYVPFEKPLAERRAWLLGALSAVGELTELGWGLASEDRDLIREMRLLALDSGLQPNIRIAGTVSALFLNGFSEPALTQPHSFVLRKPVTVAAIHPLPFTVPVLACEGKLVANGYCVGSN